MAVAAPRSRTPDAYAQTLQLQCPHCAHRLVRDEFGAWCSTCLWCGTCQGRGCASCPQEDAYRDMGVAPATPIRWCETCQQSPRLGTHPQCTRCLRLRLPPAEVVPLVGTNSTSIREKRLRWLLAHPGWGLSPNRQRLLRLAGTKDNPFGTQMLLVEYAVERGPTSVV